MTPLRDLCTPPDLGHLRRLTTPLGIWQHTVGTDPDTRLGYSIDDVARALIVVNEFGRLFPALQQGTTEDPRSIVDLAEISLHFLETFQRADGRFHNFVNDQGKALDDVGSEDSFGRTVWALGHTMAHGLTNEHRSRATRLFAAAERHIAPTFAAHTNAFLILGISEILGVSWDAHWAEVGRALITDLLTRLENNTTAGWVWFGEDLRYSNGAFPLVLLRGGSVFVSHDDRFAKRAWEGARGALDFLLRVTMSGGVPAPVGNRGWYPRGGTRAHFDQQPVDAAAMVFACLEAWSVFREESYCVAAEAWLRWYEGRNSHGVPLLADDGSVHDGLGADGVNQNCGAESIVTYLLARLRWVELLCSHGDQG